MNPSKNHPVSCGLATSTFNRTFKKKSLSERSFDLSITPTQRITNNPSVSVINLDKNDSTSGTPLTTFSRSTEASYVTDFIINASILKPDYFQNISYYSDNINIVSHPIPSGLNQQISSYQGTGTAVIKGVSTDGETVIKKVNSYSQIGATVDTFLGWASGSLAHHCTNQIDNLIATKTQKNVYTVANGSSFVRNSDCWINSVDMSCASPWNSTGGNIMAGTLISPRHVMFCKHFNFYPSIGATMYFVSQSGDVVTRTISSIQQVTSPSGPVDIAIGYLNSDVPNTIKFAKILPSNWSTYLPNIHYTKKIPSFWFNQFESASIYTLYELSNIFGTNGDIKYSNFYNGIIRFDSGSPYFILINNEPVLLGVLTGGGTGAFVSSFITEINNTMSSLGGSYTLSNIDLSGFSTY
jgi:hypothetical protein